MSRRETSDRKRLFVEHAVVLSAYLLLAVFMTYPLAVLDGNTGITPPSNDITVVWGWANQCEQFFIWHPLDFFAALSPSIIHPLDNPLFFGDHGFGNALLYAPGYFITGRNPFVAAHIFMLLSYLLSAWAMYLFAKHFWGNRAVAFIAGICFSYTGFRLAIFWDPQCINATYLVLSFLFLEKYLATEQRRYAFFLAAALVAQMYSYTYFFVMLSTFLVVYLALHPRRLVAFRHWRVSLGALAIALVAAIPLIAILAHVMRYEYFLSGNTRIFPGMHYGIHSLVRVARSSWLYRGLLAHGSFINFAGVKYREQALFPGITMITMFCLGLATLRKTAPLPILGLLIITLLGFTFATRIGDSNDTFEWVSRHFPPFTLIRTPLRFMVFFQIGFALFGAAGVVWLVHRVGSRWSGLVVAVIAAAVVLENTSVPFEKYSTEVFERRHKGKVKLEFDEATPLSEWLRDGGVVPDNEAVLELPAFLYLLGEDLTQHVVWHENCLLGAHGMFQFLHHQRTLADGWTGHLPKGFLPIKRFDLRDPSVRRHLGAIGVRWIVIHDDFLTASQAEMVEHEDLVRNGFVHVKSMGRDRVYCFSEPIELAPKVGVDVRFGNAGHKIVFFVPGRDRDERRIWLNPLKCRKQSVTAMVRGTRGEKRTVRGEFVLPLTIQESHTLSLEEMGLAEIEADKLAALEFDQEQIIDWHRGDAPVTPGS